MLQTQTVSSCLPAPLKFAKSTHELSKVIEFRANGYRKIYPTVEIAKNDPFNEHAYVIYSSNDQDHVNSTGSIILDSKQGLPEDKLFPSTVNNYRRSGKKLMEIGRFFIGEKQHLLKHYYKAVYEIALRKDVDIVLMIIRQKDIAFHQILMGADILSKDIGENFGSNFSFACIAWDIEKTKAKFNQWVASV